MENMNDRIRTAASRKRLTATPPVPDGHRKMNAALRAAAGTATDEDLDLLACEQADTGKGGAS